MPRGDLQIQCGKTKSGAKIFTVTHLIGQSVRMTKETLGLLDIALCNQGAYIGGGYCNPVQGNGRDHIATDAQLEAQLLQSLGVAFALVTKTKVVSNHQVYSMILADQKFSDKLLPVHVHHILVKGENDGLYRGLDLDALLTTAGDLLAGAREHVGHLLL